MPTEEQRKLTDIPASKVTLEKEIMESDGYTVAEPIPQPNGLFTLVGTKGSQPAIP